MARILVSILALASVLAIGLASEAALELEARDLLGSKGEELKTCLGVEQWVWMTKVSTREQFKDCVRRVLNSDDGPFGRCLNIRKAYYNPLKTQIYRAEREDFLKCMVSTETFCPKKREEIDDDVESFYSEDDSALEDPETRGFLEVSQADALNECLGVVRNKFLTKVKTRGMFKTCVLRTCRGGRSHKSGGFDDAAIERVASCIGLSEEDAPGPECDWHNFFQMRRYFVMRNRGALGRCMRDTRKKC